MISGSTILRVARPTDQLQEIAQMYQRGLGYETLAQFTDHEGFDGVILGRPGAPYHLEFTHHHETSAGRAPTEDNLLIYYLPDEEEWKSACANMQAAGFRPVRSYNPYWDVSGKTFEDLDGYRVVLQNGAWSA